MVTIGPGQRLRGQLVEEGNGVSVENVSPTQKPLRRRRPPSLGNGQSGKRSSAVLDVFREVEDSGRRNENVKLADWCTASKVAKGHQLEWISATTAESAPRAGTRASMPQLNVAILQALSLQLIQKGKERRLLTRTTVCGKRAPSIVRREMEDGTLRAWI